MEKVPTDVPGSDRELESPDAPTAEDLDGLSMKNQRLARIQDFEEDAVSRTGAYAAVMGMGTAYLQRIFEHLGAAVLDVMDSHPHSVQELRELRPEIRLLVQLRKTIETDLEVQSSDAGDQPSVFPQSLKHKGLDANLATSKRGLLPKRWRVND